MSATASSSVSCRDWVFNRPESRVKRSRQQLPIISAMILTSPKIYEQYNIHPVGKKKKEKEDNLSY